MYRSTTPDLRAGLHRALSGLVLLVAAGAFLSGCGYALVGRASNVPEDIRTIYVEALENRTSRSQVEQILTRAIIDELVTRRQYEVVSERAGADAEIRGAVTNFNTTPVGFNTDGRANQYELTIIAQVVFQRVDLRAPPDEEPEVIWRNDGYQFREAYDVDEAAESYFDREDASIEDAAERFAETMVSDLLEGF